MMLMDLIFASIQTSKSSMRLLVLLLLLWLDPIVAWAVTSCRARTRPALFCCCAPLVKTTNQPILEDELISPGIPEGFFITQSFDILTDDRFCLENIEATLVERLGLTPTNVTLPIALTLLDPVTFPTLSRARKACRKKRIVISLCNDDEQQQQLGRVSDRVTSETTRRIGVQERLSHGSYSKFISAQPPCFELPVVYEDDYLAIVNKPAGILVYSEGEVHGRNTIRNALPHVVQPPSLPLNNHTAFARPELCHRLDKPTSGLLIAAKTKETATHLSRLFENRLVQKTYTAICIGEPSPINATTLSSQEAFDMGVDVDPTSNARWYLADGMLEDKQATTLWRVLKHQPTADGKGLSVVELKPKTGRHHQLRRQMAWWMGAPIAGDTTYGGEIEQRWGRGLMLCSNKVVFSHPTTTRNDGGNVVEAEIAIPNKFERFLASQAMKLEYHQQS